MFLKAPRAGEWMCLLVVMERDGDSWQEISIVHKPWWDPSAAFTTDELIAVGGHSRFGGRACPEIVVIPGQAAANARVRRLESDDVQDPLGQGLWGHFVYVGCLDEPGAPVSLVAERDGAQETVTIKMYDPWLTHTAGSSTCSIASARIGAEQRTSTPISHGSSSEVS
jgi:hypothetical protein